MALTAGDVMSPQVMSVGPDLGLPELERAFFDARVSGFPVVEDGRLVGIVSRSDVVRQLCVEGTRAEELSGYYVEVSGFTHPSESLEEIGRRVGARIEKLTVADVMIHDLVTLGPEAPVSQVAALLLERGIHRVLICEGERLVGIVSSTDLVRLVAEQVLTPS